MDTVANTLVALMNAQRIGKKRVVLKRSRLVTEMLKLLQERGIVAKVREQATPFPQLIVTLLYTNGQPRVRGVKRLSKPGQRRYVTKDTIPYAHDGVGIMLISTSRGVMDGETARKRGVGGELLCEVW